MHARTAIRHRLIWHHLLPLGLYLLLTLVLTYPLLTHFTTQLPGDGADAWQNYWNYWWLRTALADGQQPYQTSLLYAPFGAPLYLHTLNPFNGLLSMPIQIAFGLTAAYNSVVIFSLTLAGYGAYLLTIRLSGNHWAGFVGGVIYAFGSYHLSHLLGHANLLASEWLPLYLFFLVNASSGGLRQQWRYLLAASIALVYLALCDWQYLLFAAFLTLLYAPLAALQQRRLTPLLAAGIAGLGGLVLTLPLLIPTARELVATASSRPPVLGAENFSADLLSFFVPSPLHSLWGTQAERLGRLALAPAVERSVFLGLGPLLLAGAGVVLRRRQALIWVLGAVIFFVLALGPLLQIGGQPFSGVPMPYRLLQQIPGVNLARVPARFALLVTLCLAILAALGLVSLIERFPRLRQPPIARLAFSLLVVVLLLEHIAIPYPLTAVVEPPFYRQLATTNEPGAVLELPFVLSRSTSLFGQTVHHHPLIGGYLSRPLAYPLQELPPFAATTTPNADITPPLTVATGRWLLRYSDVRWLVVLRRDPKLNQQEIAEYLRNYAEPTPLSSDDQMTVYRPLAPGPPEFALRVTEGWHLPEKLADQRLMRWLAHSASLETWSFNDTAQSGTLQFQAWSFNQPRRLQLSIDGVVVQEWLVAEPKQYRVPVTLTPGEHTITLTSLDPPERPNRTIGGNDDRLIAIGVAEVTLR